MLCYVNKKFMSVEILDLPSVTVAEAKPEDAYGIVSVLRETWLDTYPNPDFNITPEDILLKFGDFQEKVNERKEYLKRIAGDPSVGYWVTKDENGVIGFIYTRKKRGNRIEALYVTPRSQNKGVGTTLMNKALAWFEDGSITTVVVSYNNRAISFYHRFGFTEAGNVVTTFGALPNGKTLPETKLIKYN